MPAEPILTVRSPHPGQRHQRPVARTVEHHVLPDLVAECGHVEPLAVAGEQVEILGGEQRGARVEGIVQHHDAGPRPEGLRQRGLVEAEGRGLQRHDPRHAARPPYEGQVGVVHGREQHDLVAGLDQRQERAGQRLRGPGGDHHLGLRVEDETLVPRVMGGDRLPQGRQPHHRGILVPAVAERPRAPLADILRPGIVGEALAEIDRAVDPREPGHGLEHRRGEGVENGVDEGGRHAARQGARLGAPGIEGVGIAGL